MECASFLTSRQRDIIFHAFNENLIHIAQFSSVVRDEHGRCFKYCRTRAFLPKTVFALLAVYCCCIIHCVLRCAFHFYISILDGNDILSEEKKCYCAPTERTSWCTPGICRAELELQKWAYLSDMMPSLFPSFTCICYLPLMLDTGRVENLMSFFFLIDIKELIFDIGANGHFAAVEIEYLIE
jgi:hypothetical protein